MAVSKIRNFIVQVCINTREEKTTVPFYIPIPSPTDCVIYTIFIKNIYNSRGNVKSIVAFEKQMFARKILHRVRDVSFAQELSITFICGESG